MEFIRKSKSLLKKVVSVLLFVFLIFGFTGPTFAQVISDTPGFEDTTGGGPTFTPTSGGASGSTGSPGASGAGLTTGDLTTGGGGTEAQIFLRGGSSVDDNLGNTVDEVVDEVEDALEQIFEDAVECSIENLISTVVKGAVGKVLSLAGEWLKDKITEKLIGTIASPLSKVPVLDDAVVAVNEKIHNASKILANKDAKYDVFDNGWLILPHEDSIAWCLKNAVIKYVHNDAIRYFKNGYGGNPLFITNFQEFFGDIQKEIAEDFLTTVITPENLGHGLHSDLTRAYGYESSLGVPECAFELSDRMWREFKNGVVAAGGYDGLVAFHAYPGCNPFMKQLIAQDKLLQQIESASKRAADQVLAQGGIHAPVDENGRIKYPAQVIKDHFVHRVTKLEDIMADSDEAGEVLDALWNGVFEPALDKILDSAERDFVGQVREI